MSDTTLFIASRLLLALIFAAVGGYSLRLGYRLYINGVGLEEEESELKIKTPDFSINLSMKRVGTFVIAISVPWGFFAWQTKPSSIDRDFEGGEHYTAIVTVDDLARLSAAVIANQPAPQSVLDDLQSAIASKPENEALLLLDAAIQSKSGRRTDAIRTYRTLLQANPDSPPATLGLAGAQFAQGDLAAALETLREASARDIEDAETTYLQAQIQVSRQDRAAAKALFERTLELDPNHVGANNDLAWLLAQDGQQLDRALELAESAQSFSPTPEVLDTIGFIFLRRGEYTRAIAALGSSVKEDPDSPTARYHLGLALQASGDREAAREAFDRVISDWPTAEAARLELSRPDAG